MRTIIITIALLFLTSCVTTRTEKVNSWIGKDVNQLVYSQWGYPNETKEAPNGNKLLIYEEKKTRLESERVYKPSGTKKKGTWESVDYAVEERCLTFFEVDNNEKVVNVHWRCQ